MSKEKGLRAFQNARLRKQQGKVSGTFAQALTLHQRGMVADAQALYSEILEKVPNHFDALHHLGIAASQGGRYEEAERLLARALGVDPRSAAAYSNRGIALHELKRFEEAVESFHHAIAIKPDFPEALSNLGNALAELERFEEAVAAYDKAIALKPDYAEALANRGHALRELRRYDEAVASCERAIAIRPTLADAHSNRGFALSELKRADEALASFDKALAIKPALAAAWLGRGNLLFDKKLIDEALAAYGKALAIRPDYFKVLIQLAACHGVRGNIEEAVACYDRALALKPDFSDGISNRIFTLDFAPNVGFAEHQEARKFWWRQVGVKIADRAPRHHANSLDSARRIVVGYVSADFRNHSASAAVKPVLAHHDKSRFEVICYSCSAVEDEVTTEFRRIADRWRSASQLSDEQLADRIREDQVDILVDLSGHSAGNRLAVFAAKPAPIQVTAWGHATGTGLPTFDYLFSDSVAIPGAVRHLFAEKIYDLPCLITMEPPFLGFSASDLPALALGHVTFGVFNRISKISDDAVALWARILHSVPRSRIVIKDHALDSAALRTLLGERFARHGVSAERIDLMGSTSRIEHLLAFGNVDIALDPFPQNGGISTWEAVHMGVPVVAKLGNSVPSRLSGAILSSIGLGDWVAESMDDYHAIAVKYASMPEHLEALRRELPSRIAVSPAGNNVLYAKAVEAAYRSMWERYVSAMSVSAARA